VSSIEFTKPDAVTTVEGGRILLARHAYDVRLGEDELGRRGLRGIPPREKWAPWTTRFETKGAHTAVVVIIGCPKCSGIIYLPHTPNSAKALTKYLGIPVRITHEISPEGVVRPGVVCPHNCGFERPTGAIKLDGWVKVKRLYSGQVRRRGSLRLETVYTHAADATEALAHFSLQPWEILEAGPAPAIGWLGDEQTGKLFGG